MIHAVRGSRSRTRSRSCSSPDSSTTCCCVVVLNARTGTCLDLAPDAGIRTGDSSRRLGGPSLQSHSRALAPSRKVHRTAPPRPAGRLRSPVESGKEDSLAFMRASGIDQEAYPLPRVRLCHLGRQRAPSDRLSQRMPASGRAQEPDRAFTGGHNAMPLFRLWLLFHRSAGGCSPIVRASCTINAGRSPRLRQHPPPLGGIGSQGPHHAWEARRDHALVKCTRFVRDDRPAM